MALTRGGFRHYDYDRMVVLFTATNVATEVACAISSAAMDDQPPSVERCASQPPGSFVFEASQVS